MNDTIWLRGISGHGTHGVHQFERLNGQRFVVDVGLTVDTRAPARSDDLSDTVSYADVAARVHGLLTGPPVALVETLAERAAEAALSFPGVLRVEVAVHKPQAPITVPFDDVAVTIIRTPLTLSPTHPVPCVLALGGNIGDTPRILRDAVAELEADLGPLRCGPLVRTAALTLPGTQHQADYRNTVVVGETRLAAMEVLELAHRIETRHGRTRTVRWGPRTLDIDVIAWGDVVSDDPELLLPHPGAADRAFVVVPWAALQPEATLNGRSLAELARPLRGEVLDRHEAWR